MIVEGDCYGACSAYNTSLGPEWFVEEERGERNVLTGRKRRACSSLWCPCCFKNHVVDDSFDGERYR